MWKKRLRDLIKIGRLRLIAPNGDLVELGGTPYLSHHRQLEVTVRLHGSLTPFKLMLDPHRYLGESYMNGDLTIERGDLWDFIELIGYNFEEPRPDITNGFAALANSVLRRIQQHNDLTASRRNVAHHYDLSEDFYRLFLDADMQYSCAYFRSPNASIEEAQTAKKEHIAAKLLLAPGMRVLDIGCGWGGMALFLARTHQVRVVGITLSTEQLAVARARAMGLEDRVSFELMDYRKVEGSFDRIVSVGMFEHVGIPQYAQYFQTMTERLAPDGVALVHSIGRMRGPSRTSGFIRKFIFPGGYVPALSEVLPTIERSGLWLTDLEVLRIHYAETLRLWRERFMANRHRLPPQYDEKFCRMWEFYLASSEMSFRFNGFMVFQLQLSRSVNAVPLTRDYMTTQEHLMATAAE
ncbi:cyclopropane-fatty-acyl-phospholipid synthase family protein [Lichenifustis flavocetrariae]|uniref:Cyclopropane-fatty-acyl-phospholipid synthase family protein n=1 Tax=Lichenifustis flavocetrariae TaxID=2949735 RepID=A0AA42CID1_9HYPH|nr:cyclopropane-fatty-acyl-phospholipid synthase family protein [Lichenifustis flavocetrariae]MCW6508239.1 cyclopropane-fatty-acyl-phospholipid synthase family protein [Lichenifustis flavocetrariae]